MFKNTRGYEANCRRTSLGSLLAPVQPVPAGAKVMHSITHIHLPRNSSSQIQIRLDHLSPLGLSSIGSSSRESRSR
jgi:hypothetical protein